MRSRPVAIVPRARSQAHTPNKSDVGSFHAQGLPCPVTACLCVFTPNKFLNPNDGGGSGAQGNALSGSAKPPILL